MKLPFRGYRLVLSVFILAASWQLGAQFKKATPSRPSTTEQPPDPIQGSPKIITATKGVNQFWDLENQLAHALGKKDQPTLDKMLPEEFEVWMPNVNGSAVGREDWLASQKENPSPTIVAQMSVQMYPDLAVVKFIGKGKAPATGKGAARQYFVVDVWELHDNKWELTNRYMAEIASIPLPRRPSGKQ